MEVINWVQLWQILRQYGPVVALLPILIYWQSRRIDKLLDRNTEIYESHIKQLYETQKTLLTKLIGSQPSSDDEPTMQQLKETVKQADGKEDGSDKQ